VTSWLRCLAASSLSSPSVQRRIAAALPAPHARLHVRALSACTCARTHAGQVPGDVAAPVRSRCQTLWRPGVLQATPSRSPPRRPANPPPSTFPSKFDRSSTRFRDPLVFRAIPAITSPVERATFIDSCIPLRSSLPSSHFDPS